MENNVVMNIPKDFVVDEVATFRIKINKLIFRRKENRRRFILD